MASHKSAAKRARQTVQRTIRNTSTLSRVKTAIKRFRDAVTGGDTANVTPAFQTASRELRKAATKGVMHASTASRRVSRLALAHNAATKKSS